MKTWLIRKLIAFSQWLPAFRARGSYSYSKRFLKHNQGLKLPYPRSECEFQDHESLEANIHPFNITGLIRGKTVLDFGSGYGGRTVWYAQYAKFVDGIEIFPSLVDISKKYALSKKTLNVNFSLGSEESIAFPGEYFDVIISFDVLEHVKRPDLIMAEFQRILKKGGLAIVIFTPYYGMFAHHLNYITLFPGLHWFFSPRDLIAAINELLESHPKFKALGIQKQPAPVESFNGKRQCLPALNGLTLPEYKDLVRQCDFEILELKSNPILARIPCFRFMRNIFQKLNQWLGLEEQLSYNLVSILRKR
ncbi:MAG: class I SAM-dependent methyltransferase [Firmicutes bacterium]|nr:class I SAM-dependent methyltransferase [Bacillota bacterium]